MSDDSVTTAIPCAVYTGLPVLMEENFTDWDLQIVTHLTGMHNHICVITQTRQLDSMIVNPMKLALQTQVPPPTRRGWPRM